MKQVLVLVAVINLPTIRKLNANRWHTATDVEALPSANIPKSDAPLRKSSGDNLIAAKLIRIDSQLPVQPQMKRLEHKEVRSPSNVRHHRLRPTDIRYEISTSSRSPCAWRS